MGTVRTIVHGDRPGDRVRAGRTRRALATAGLHPMDLVGQPPRALADALATAPGPVLLVRSGAWLAGPVALPPPSATGRALCALGAVLPAPLSPASMAAADWSRLLARTGGVLDGGEFPEEIASVYLETRLLPGLVAHVAAGAGVASALRALLHEQPARVVRHAPLDVHQDDGLRVAQVVTSLQRGGAERVALDLASQLPERGISSLLVMLGAPTREAFEAPCETLDLAGAGDRHERLAHLGRALLAFGADLVHGHLLERPDVTCLAETGVPVVLTVHNVRAGWPAGTETIAHGEAALLVGCSRAAEEDLRLAGLPIPARTVWNGIDFSPFERTEDRLRAAREWRGRLGIGSDDLILLAVANPRPQKRLDRLPGILAAVRAELRRLGLARDARLVLAGELRSLAATGCASLDAMQAEAARLGLRDRVHLAGSVADLGPLLFASDVLLSTSAHEGLSLALLEALAAGLPVIATAVGGTPEVALDNPAVTLVPDGATPERFARIVAMTAAAPPGAGREAARAHFTRQRMAEGYARLYPRAAAGTSKGDGLLLVTNNFSTGGAQSSARRLLLGLAKGGVRTRAAVLQEQAGYPTPGRSALAAAGIPVRVLAEARDPAVAVGKLVEALGDDPPEAVLFWNAIPEHKVLLADALFDIPLYDASPGEMFFASLERYFARPRPGLPYRTPAEYGARLSGVIVKYRAEAARAREVLRAPIHVIPNGVEIAPGAQRTGGSGPLVFGTAARLAPDKKLEHLLQALRHANGRLPPHVLRVAGGEESGAPGYAARLRSLAEGLPVDWVGEVPDTGPFLRSLDVFALVAEPAGCPNASLEAMAEGLPIVATDSGGIAEQVEDEVTGRLVPRGDIPALAEALVALARDPDARRRLGAEARARVAERFSLGRMVAAYRSVCLGDR